MSLVPHKDDKEQRALYEKDKVKFVRAREINNPLKSPSQIKNEADFKRAEQDAKPKPEKK